MENFAMFIKEYWFIIILVIAVISVVTINIYNWVKKPTSEQLHAIQEWLLFAVAKAEQELGSGTGQLKLRYVYNMFMEKFPAVAIFITFDDFSKMVDKALEKFEELLKSNERVQYMYGIEKEKEDEE